MRVKNVLILVIIQGGFAEEELWAFTPNEIKVPIFGHLTVRDRATTIFIMDKIQIDYKEKCELLKKANNEKRWIRVSGEIEADNQAGAWKELDRHEREDGEISLEWGFTLYADVIEFVSDHEVEETTD